MMEMVKSGAVTNQYKKKYQGKSLTSYAIGTPVLMEWLDNNPLVEFQSIEQVFNPVHISRNPKYVSVLPARKVDLSGRIALHTGRGNVGTGPGEVIDFFNGGIAIGRGAKQFSPCPAATAGKNPTLCFLRCNTPINSVYGNR